MFTEGNEMESESAACIAGTPIRMCLGCRERSPQSSLLRIYLAAQDDSNESSWLVVDPAKSVKKILALMVGRSTYVHPSADCITKACIGKRLQRAYQKKISENEVNSLRRQLMSDWGNQKSGNNYG